MIYLVTNRQLNKGNYYEVIEEACQSGIDGLILREKDLDYSQYREIAKKVHTITSHYQVPLILNGNLRLCQELNLHGYHSTFLEIVERGKRYKYQGVSIHSVSQAIQAEQFGVDYLLAGHIFATQSKAGLAPRGREFLEELKTKVKLPIIAIGGINADTIHTIKDIGIHGYAVMSYLLQSSHLRESLGRLKKDR